MTKTIKEYFDPYGIKPRVHAPIRDKEKLKEFEEYFDIMKEEVNKMRKINNALKIGGVQTLSKFFGVDYGDFI